MSKMRIEAKPALEAYIGKSGDICLKQENPGKEEIIINIPPEYVEKVIKWLQILTEERGRLSDDKFDVVDG